MAYYKERKPRKFNFDNEAPKGAGKRAMRVIILLLFLIAALIWFFPDFFKDASGQSGAVNTEFSSVGGALYARV
ncbi:MAG: hypothetical protein LBK57_01265 [Clostridiales Family XIII bacterium]|jgi:hypothetical protein|nr:hypothetical protein [Clostridiales Family XIII bacterium]